MTKMPELGFNFFRFSVSIFGMKILTEHGCWNLSPPKLLEKVLFFYKIQSIKSHLRHCEKVRNQLARHRRRSVETIGEK